MGLLLPFGAWALAGVVVAGDNTDLVEADGSAVRDSRGTNYAPAVFVREPEAKDRKIGKAVLEDAMRRLKKDGRIRTEEYKKDSHTRTRLVRVR